MLVDFRILSIERCDVLLDVLTHGVTVIRTRIFDRLQAQFCHQLADFLLAVVEQRAQYRDAGARKRRYGQKGAQLAAGYKIHKEGFYGIVIVVRQCHLVEAKLLRAAVGGCTAEIGTGEAGAAALFSCAAITSTSSL